MKVLIQNLQKRSGLATDLLNEHDPDVMLAQEISITYERNHYDDKYYAHNTSSLGYGTAIYSKGHDIRKVKLVEAPCSEFVGTIRKKTTIATCTSHYIQFVSLHGYNGTPFRTTSTAKLVAHVQTVLDVLDPVGPAVVAGDFNTWTQDHLDAVKSVMEHQSNPFRLVHSWPYPGRTVPLDHVFLREIALQRSSWIPCHGSDHNGGIIEIFPLPPALL